MEFITVVGLIMLSIAFVSVMIVVIFKIREYKRPIRVTILRQLTDKVYERLSFAKLGKDKTEFEFNKHKYPLKYTNFKGENKAIDYDVVRDGRYIFYTFLEDHDTPLSYGRDTTPDTKNSQLITESHFLRDIFAEMPKIYTVVMLACIAVAIVGVIATIFLFTQYNNAQTQIVSLTEQFGALNGTYVLLQVKYQLLQDWIINNVPQSIINATNGTITIH